MWIRLFKIILASMFIALFAYRGITYQLRLATEHRAGGDFDNIYYAAKATLSGYSYFDNGVINDLYKQDGGTSYQLSQLPYPPFAILIFAPLVHLRLLDARIVWQIASWFFLWGTIVILRGLARRLIGLDVSGLIWLAFATFCSTAFSPVMSEMTQGQINLAYLVLWVAGIALVFSGRPRDQILAGAFIGASTLAKLFPGIVILFLLTQKRWCAAIASLLSILCLAGLSQIWLPPDSYLRYLEMLVKTDYVRSGSYAMSNYSLRHLWITLVSEMNLPNMLDALVLVPLLFALFMCKNDMRFSDRVDLISALRLCASFLFAGLIMATQWDMHFVFCLPILTLLLCAWWAMVPRDWLGLMTVALGVSLIGAPAAGLFSQTTIASFRLSGIMLTIVMTELTIRQIRANAMGKLPSSNVAI